jgi:uncharacterized protein CbrC (UPF0167 family)
MDLNQICEWLIDRDYEHIASILLDKFNSHTWTVDGMIRTDIIEEIFERVYGTTDMFRAMECDVATHMQFIPDYEAHVD